MQCDIRTVYHNKQPVHDISITWTCSILFDYSIIKIGSTVGDGSKHQIQARVRDHSNSCSPSSEERKSYGRRAW